MVYAPLKYQGLVFPNLYVETGIQHISLVLQETYHNSLTGTLLCMSIEAAKVEVGVGGPLFMQPFERFGILAMESWVKHTWQFLSEYGITIEDKVGDI